MAAVAELTGVPGAGGWLLLQPTKATALAQNNAPVVLRIHDLLYIGTISLVLSIRAIGQHVSRRNVEKENRFKPPIEPVFTQYGGAS